MTPSFTVCTHVFKDVRSEKAKKTEPMAYEAKIGPLWVYLTNEHPRFPGQFVFTCQKLDFDLHRLPTALSYQQAAEQAIELCKKKARTYFNLLWAKEPEAEKADVEFTEASTQKLFPLYTLSEEEMDWCLHYQRQTGFELTQTEEVKDQESFIEMMRSNWSWFTDWSSETAQHAEDRMRNISYYLDTVLKD